MTCAGCKAKEIYQRDNKDPEPGSKLRVEPDPNYKPSLAVDGA